MSTAGYDVIIRYNDESKKVSYEDAVNAADQPNPIASILELIGFKNVSARKVPREVVEEEFRLPSSTRGSGKRRLKDDEQKAIAKRFLAEIDAGQTQADAARAAYPDSKGQTQTVRKWAQAFFGNHQLFRAAEAPKTGRKSK